MWVIVDMETDYGWNSGEPWRYVAATYGPFDTEAEANQYDKTYLSKHDTVIHEMVRYDQ